MARHVDVVEYVHELLHAGVKPFQAVKKNCILARPGVVGEEVITWTEADGKPVAEKIETVTLDAKTGKPGYVATKLDDNYQVKIDAFGHDNTWIIDYPTFQRKYVPGPEFGEGIYKPVGGIQILIPIMEDIIIHQWGKEMLVCRGGYINITNVDDMYGISERDFMDTYKAIPGEPEMVKKITME